MFLSRLTLNPRSRDVRRDLADVYQLHRTIMSGFGGPGEGSARESLGVLFRTEPLDGPFPVVLVQSHQEPSWQLPLGYLAPGTTTVFKPIDGLLKAISAGETYRFRLLANPTRKIARFDEAGSRLRQGSRVDIRRDEDRLAWLARKGVQHGFELVRFVDEREGAADVVVRSTPRQTGRRAGARVTAAGVLFDGRFIASDVERLRDAVVNGVGPGKAFGFGLLSLGADR
jgi:CRISPR system Cascade subunit CasE